MEHLPDLERVISTLCADVAHDPTRLLDIARGIQDRWGHVPPEALDLVAREMRVPRIECEGLVSFYAFLSRRPAGQIPIRLCDAVIERMRGSERVGNALSEALGIGFGETTPDGRFSLWRSSCIGMSDQAPAALVGNVVVTRLSSDGAHELVRALRRHGDPERLVERRGDGNNASPLIHAMVENNVRLAGDVVLAPLEPGLALHRALAMTPAEVIRTIKTARLRGRGGAGFPAGMKWEYTRAAAGDRKFVICNADEGEPGTFKDRVILTEHPETMLEGMTIAAYAMGAREGLIYLRAEYAYLKRWLDHVLAERRRRGLLGEGILGERFSFDVRIQLGAGAYVCGEETALINSAEGRRGEPRNRPPFPAQAGYLGCPTSVNNVETLCCAARVFEHGAGWFARRGVEGSTGTKLFSVSGDCLGPGVYELPLGTALRELLALCGGEDSAAVQVGGPSGQMVPPEQFDRKLSFDDLATGGSIMVFGRDRDLLAIASQFLHFFADESCGHCTPCRVGTVLLEKRLDQIRDRLGSAEDLEYLLDLASTVKLTSRCGLGQTAPNPVLSTLQNFRDRYETLLQPGAPALRATFDPRRALEQARRIAGRDSTHFPGAGEEHSQ